MTKQVLLRLTYVPAGVFNEPLSDLMKVLASLVDADNHILVKGFLDRVWLSSRPFLALQGNGSIPQFCRKALTCHEACFGRLQAITPATHSRYAKTACFPHLHMYCHDLDLDLDLHWIC